MNSYIIIIVYLRQHLPTYQVLLRVCRHWWYCCSLHGATALFYPLHLFNRSLLFIRITVFLHHLRSSIFSSSIHFKVPRPLQRIFVISTQHVIHPSQTALRHTSMAVSSKPKRSVSSLALFLLASFSPHTFLVMALSSLSRDAFSAVCYSRFSHHKLSLPCYLLCGSCLSFASWTFYYTTLM